WVTEDTLRVAAEKWFGEVLSMYLRIDDHDISDLRRYAAGPTRFSYVSPRDGVACDLFPDTSCTEVRIDVSFTTGYWIMLSPLSPGQHAIAFGGSVLFDNAPG